MFFSIQNKEQFNQFHIHDFQLIKYSYNADNNCVELQMKKESVISIIFENILGLKFSNAGPWGGSAVYINGWQIFSDMTYLFNKFDFPAREFLNIESGTIVNITNNIKKTDDFFQVSIGFTSGDELQILTNGIRITE